MGRVFNDIQCVVYVLFKPAQPPIVSPGWYVYTCPLVRSRAFASSWTSLSWILLQEAAGVSVEWRVWRAGRLGCHGRSCRHILPCIWQGGTLCWKVAVPLCPEPWAVFDTQTRIFYEFPEFHSVALVRGGSYKGHTSSDMVPNWEHRTRHFGTLALATTQRSLKSL